MTRRLVSLGVAVCAAVVLGGGIEGQPAPAWPAPGTRVYLHAHNGYPDQGRWNDRLTRALRSGAPHLAIEQDLMWVPARAGRPARSVVAHDVPARGDEPTIDEHFFATVAPLLDAALRERRTETWPVLVLHLDFKTNEPAHHRYVWDLLGRRPEWLTTAERTAGGSSPSPLRPGPLLVLTEQGEGQEWAFHLTHPIGTPLRLFGTVPLDVGALPDDAAARATRLATMPVEQLVPSAATSYRRWTNHSWAVIERGGAPGAADWLPAEEARLDAIVRLAHARGLWIRFYGLNGHEDAGDGWSAGYNFGSPAAVRRRWRAAIEAGVEFIATDQYELLADELSTVRRRD